jgi:hypothetical protein
MNNAWSSYLVVKCICCCTIPAALFILEAFISKANFSHFSDICPAFGAIMYLWEPKGGRDGRSVGLFYCLILAGLWYMYSYFRLSKAFDCLFWEKSVYFCQIRTKTYKIHQLNANISVNLLRHLYLLCISLTELELHYIHRAAPFIF